MASLLVAVIVTAIIFDYIWGVAGNLVIAWVLTLPLSGLVAYFATLICMRLFA